MFSLEPAGLAILPWCCFHKGSNPNTSLWSCFLPIAWLCNWGNVSQAWEEPPGLCHLPFPGTGSPSRPMSCAFQVVESRSLDSIPAPAGSCLGARRALGLGSQCTVLPTTNNIFFFLLVNSLGGGITRAETAYGLRCTSHIFPCGLAHLVRRAQAPTAQA